MSIDRIRVVSVPACPGEVILELPEYTYRDTQTGSAELGLPTTWLPSLR